MHLASQNRAFFLLDDMVVVGRTHSVDGMIIFYVVPATNNGPPFDQPSSQTGICIAVEEVIKNICANKGILAIYLSQAMAGANTVECR